MRDLPAEKILQLNNLYLLAPTDDGLMLIDQHAAHERILYEQFLDEFKSQQKNPGIKLPKPFNFELPLTDTHLLVDHLKLFAKKGFKISLIKDKDTSSFSITHIPELFKNRSDIPDIILQILDDMKNGLGQATLDDLSHQLIKFLSCKKAIKAGDFLEPSERKRLLEKLETCKNPYTCPHGRPTKILLELDELERMFKRT